MITIWEDAPEPIEYRAKRCSCAFIFKFLSPIILVLLTCWFVLMTYYIAPTTISTTDTPSIERPQYYLISSIVDQTGTTGGSRFSYFGCNFPAFQRRSIIPLYEAPIYKFSVDPYNRVNITLDVPFGQIVDTHIIIPLGFHFNYYDKPAIFSYLSLRITGDGTQDVFTYSGNLNLQQNGDLVQTAASLSEYLNAIDPINYLDIFSIDDVVNHFADSPIKLQFISPRIQKTISDTAAAGTPSTRTTYNIQFNVPSMVVNMPAPYWNVFRNTYIQLFYWCWVLIAIFSPFIQAAYQYGIIPTTQRKLLKPYSKPKTD